MAEKPLFREIQLDPAEQQISPGSLGSTVEQAVAVELAHVESRASHRCRACAEDTVLDVRYARLSLSIIVFDAIMTVKREV